MRRPHKETLAMDSATNKGAWSKQEDDKLIAYIHKYGEGSWRTLPHAAGLMRCGKSCRLRWVNYLKPGVKRGNFSDDEEDLIIKLHALLGNRWSLISGRLPGRTDNEVKNYWNTHLRRKLIKMGVDPNNHRLHQTLVRPIGSEPSSKMKVITNAGDFRHHQKLSKSSQRDHDEGSNTEQVSDSGSCLLEDCNSASTNCELPDLNLDLTLTSSISPSLLETKNSNVKVEHQGCNDESILLGEIHEQGSTSPTLLLFT